MRHMKHFRISAQTLKSFNSGCNQCIYTNDWEKKTRGLPHFLQTISFLFCFFGKLKIVWQINTSYFLQILMKSKNTHISQVCFTSGDDTDTWQLALLVNMYFKYVYYVIYGRIRLFINAKMRSAKCQHQKYQVST